MLGSGELRPSGQHTFSRPVLTALAVSRLLGASSLNSSTVSLIYPAWASLARAGLPVAGALDTGFTVNV